jgi:hypothetical protein
MSQVTMLRHMLFSHYSELSQMLTSIVVPTSHNGHGPFKLAWYLGHMELA